jgi:hypothetical protein
MHRRKERIRKGLEIDFDLIDSDVVRWHLSEHVGWIDVPQPIMVWVEHVDAEDWVEGDEPQESTLTRVLRDATEIARGRRLVRLIRYKSYADLDDLASRPPEKGEFVIRKPPLLGCPAYVGDYDEDFMPDGLADCDRKGFFDADCSFFETADFDEVLCFSHAEAVRLTIRIMLAEGMELPGDHGRYWEPVRYEVAEELHRRALDRPHLSARLHEVINDLSREP